MRIRAARGKLYVHPARHRATGCCLLGFTSHDPSRAYSRYPRLTPLLLYHSPACDLSRKPLSAFLCPAQLPCQLDHCAVASIALHNYRSVLLAMAAVTMAASSLTALVAAPGAASASSTSFCKFSSVRMAPPRLNRRLSVVAMAQPNQTKKDMQEEMEKAILEAQKACESDPTSAPCAVAWDDVEERAAEAAHQRARKKANSDPLETYCAENPETDECRVYED